MSATTNLEIEKLNSADYVSVDPINNALDKLDKLGVDYVTESGTSGEWWYRKWKSGRAECGIDDKGFNDVAHTDEWRNGFFCSKALTFGNYPITFKSRPFTSINFNSATGHTSFLVNVTSTSTTVAQSVKLVDPNSGTATAVHLGIYVCGKTN